MLPFVIERLIISGLGKTDSVIEFSDGLTFVVGPSNTGKSHVMDGIDYLFGFSESATNPFRFEKDWGYDKFTLVVKTPHGNVILTRKLDEKKIKVTGTDERINHGEYSVSANGANSISSVWLKLIGIDEHVQILSSKEGKKQGLTWRGMMHLFFVNQTQIARSSSALLNPKSPTQQTASLASLLYLITGKDASEVDTPENRKLKKARREAIIAYIDESIKHLGEKIVAMEEEQAAASIPNLDEATASVQAEIDSVQREIDTAITESRSLMEKIYAGNSKISEYDTIRSRFESLQSQYTSDMERLAFIADAEAAGTKHNTVRRQMSSVILSSSTCSTIRRADKLFSLTKKKKCPHGSVRSRNASITNSPRHVGKDVMVFFMMFMMRNKLPEGTIENQL